MKKARIMLMAIAVLAIVGAGLAAKAKKFAVVTLYYGTTSTACSTNHTILTTTTTAGTVAPFTTKLYWSTKTTAICPTSNFLTTVN